MCSILLVFKIVVEDMRRKKVSTLTSLTVMILRDGIQLKGFVTGLDRIEASKLRVNMIQGQK